MKIHSFFDFDKDKEKLDIKTVVTVPDQSLTVREILTRFTSSGISLPPIETGEDEDINLDTDFEDEFEAQNYINRFSDEVTDYLQKSNEKNKNSERNSELQSEAKSEE